MHWFKRLFHRETKQIRTITHVQLRDLLTARFQNLAYMRNLFVLNAEYELLPRDKTRAIMRECTFLREYNRRDFNCVQFTKGLIGLLVSERYGQLPLPVFFCMFVRQTENHVDALLVDEQGLVFVSTQTGELYEATPELCQQVTLAVC